MFRSLSVTVLALLPAAVWGQTCGKGGYDALPGFNGPYGCVPSGYSYARDLGNTNEAYLMATCGSICNGDSNCEGFVGSLFKAADSDLYTGQCFFYPASAIPSGPASCVDRPTTIVGERKNRIAACLSSAPQASAFCTSYLSLTPVTVYTRTVTPTTTISTTTTATSVISSTTVQSTTTSTTTTVSQSTTVTSTTTSASTETDTTTTTTATTTTTTTASVGGANGKRAVRVAAPSCLSTEPASRISSACSCIVTRPTVSLVSTATVLSRSTKVSLTKFTTTTLSTSTSVIVSSTTTTTISTISTLQTVVSTSTTSTTETVTSTSTSTAASSLPTCHLNLDSHGGYNLAGVGGISSEAACNDYCKQNHPTYKSIEFVVFGGGTTACYCMSISVEEGVADDGSCNNCLISDSNCFP